MNAFSDDSDKLAASQPDALRDALLALDLQLPVEPGYRDLPPRGSWEAGYELILLALASVKNRPEIWTQRAAQMVDVEFVM